MYAEGFILLLAGEENPLSSVWQIKLSVANQVIEGLYLCRWWQLIDVDPSVSGCYRADKRRSVSS